MYANCNKSLFIRSLSSHIFFFLFNIETIKINGINNQTIKQQQHLFKEMYLYINIMHACFYRAFNFSCNSKSY